MPFADECRAVARFLEQRGQRRVAGWQANAFRRRYIDRFLEAHRKTHLIASGNQPRACRRTTRGIRISLRELQSLDCKTVDVWRRIVTLAVAAHVRITEVVRQNEDDIRLGALRPTCAAKSDPHQGQRARGGRLDKSTTGKHPLNIRHVVLPVLSQLRTTLQSCSGPSASLTIRSNSETLLRISTLMSNVRAQPRATAMVDQSVLLHARRFGARG